MTTVSRFPPRVPVLTPEISSRVQSELQPGEQLVWADQPDPQLYARGAWVISVFGVVFAAFALLWIGVAASLIWFGSWMTSGEFGFFKLEYIVPLFGFPFLAIGVGMLFAPMWTRRMGRSTVYAITDRRVIVWRARDIRGGMEVRSLGPKDLGEISRVERPDGSGDLIFKEFYTVAFDGDGGRRTARTRRGFIGIRNVRATQDLLRKTLLATQSPAAS